MVQKMGRATLRNGGSSAASFIDYYLVDRLDKNDISFRKLLVQSLTEDRLLEGFDDYLSVKWDSLVSGEIAPLMKDIYASTIGGNNIEGADRLYICVHVPLYKSSSIDSLRLIYSTFKELQMPMTMLFMGYGEDLCGVIEPGSQIESPSSVQISKFMKLRESNEISNASHFLLIQNTFSNGIPLNLDQHGLAEIMSLFAIITSKCYKQVFSTTVDYQDVIAFGISTLNLDRYLFVDYMLNKVLLQSIDKSRTMVKKVSVNDAFDKALEIVKDKDTLLSRILADYDQGGHQNFQQTCNELEAEADSIYENARQIFERDNDVTLQAAILAALLSMNDCELFTNIIYDPQKSSMNDLLMEAVDYFVANDTIGFYSDDKDRIQNPIPRIKELNSLIINSEAEVRSLQAELDTFKELGEDVQKLGENTFEEGCVIVNNKRYKLLPAKKEELLEETYVPKANQKMSVDLSSEFRPIQSQGQQGSCVAFSITSVFEYVVKLNTKEQMDLSEAFLYYNSRKLDQGESFDPTLDQGTTFTSALKSLSQFGLAEEVYCKYNPAEWDKAPSEEAYSNASIRKLVKALNVDRSATAIKSALADGYPVLASFTLCKSFNPSSNGLIPMPSADEIQELASAEGGVNRHGMVIVGYDDKLQSFLVRNSWGVDWGNRGYCYIPYEYIENQYLFNFACIVTEIQSLPIANVKRTHEMKVDDTDITIRYQICRVALAREESALEAMKNERRTLSMYLETLKRELSNPNRCEQFVALACEKKEEEKNEMASSLRQLKHKLVEEEEKYTKFKKRAVLLTILIPVIFFVGILFNNYLARSVKYSDETHKIYRDFPNNLPESDQMEESFLWYYVDATMMGDSNQMSFLQNTSGLAALEMVFVSLATGNVAWCANCLDIMMDEDNNSIGLISAIPIVLIILGIFFLVTNSRWKEWRELRFSLETAINKKSQEIQQKQKEIDNFRAKTHYAREWLRNLGDLCNKFQQRYTKLINLINTLRERYEVMKEYEEHVCLDLQMPHTSILSKDILDKYFAEILFDDDVCLINFCENVENHQIDAEYAKQYIKDMTLKIKNRLAHHKDIAEFNIDSHINSNSGASIAKVIKNVAKVGDSEISLQNLIRRSGHFVHTNSVERGVIPELTFTFKPGDDQTSYITDNPYLAIYMKVVCLKREECVMFQKKNDKK